MDAPKSAFAILSRRNMSGANAGVSAGMLSVHTSRDGVMLGAMSDAMALTKKPAETSRSWKRTVGAAP